MTAEKSPPPLRIAVLPGDGIGPEVVAEGRRVLEAVREAGLARFELETFPHGADHYLDTGETLGDEAFERLRDDFDAVLLGAVGDPRVPDGEHARDILLGLRFRLDLYVNFRPLRLRAPDLTPLRRGADGGIDFVIFRENTEGLYTGAGGTVGRGTAHEVAVSEAIATRRGVERLVRAGFEHARETGRQRVTLGDKANAVPHVYGLWRRVFGEVAEAYPDVASEARYVDALAMEMVRDPGRLGVVVAENLLGDILSDLGAELVGGMGLAPSSNVRPRSRDGGDCGAAGVWGAGGEPRCRGLYEPVHGSAPDLVGSGRANPVACVLSVALMLRDGGAHEAADRVEAAVDRALREGVRTTDVGGDRTTDEVGRWLAEAVEAG